MSAVWLSICLSTASPSGKRHSRSPVAVPAAVSCSASLSSFEKTPAYSCPSEITIAPVNVARSTIRSEEHTSEIQSLMRISYAVACLTTKTRTDIENENSTESSHSESQDTEPQ